MVAEPRGDPGPDRRRQPGRPDDRDAARPPRHPGALGRAACRHGDPPARRPLPAAHAGDPARDGARGRACARKSLGEVPARRAASTRSSRSPAEELATYVQELNEGVGALSPTVRVFINQDVLEPILRERALELGATLRNRVEVVALRAGRPTASWPRCATSTTGGERRCARRYVVAADGNRSPARGWLGIGMARLRRALAQHHDLLPRRLLGADPRPQPGRDLRPQPARCAASSGSTERGGNGFLVINTVGEDVTTARGDRRPVRA